MTGTLVLPGDVDFDDVRAIWNGMIDKRPALIARCVGAADVMRSVAFATKHELRVAIARQELPPGVLDIVENERDEVDELLLAGRCAGGHSR